jgi:hypothetical protein
VKEIHMGILDKIKGLVSGNADKVKCVIDGL